MGTMVQSVEVFDVGRALKSVGEDREFLTEIVGLVHAAWPSLLADIRKGIALADQGAVETTARLAAVAAQYVSANRTYEAARQLKTLAGAGEWQAAQQALGDLEQEVETLQIFLARLDDLG